MIGAAHTIVVMRILGENEMKVTDSRCRPIALSGGARSTSLTSQGLLKILKRTKNAIMIDGRWFVDPSIVEQIATARRVLGLDRKETAACCKKV